MIPFVTFTIFGIMLFILNRKGWGTLCLFLAMASLLVMAVG